MFALGIKKKVLRLAPLEHMLEEERADLTGAWVLPLREGEPPAGKPTVATYSVRKDHVLRRWKSKPFSDEEKRELRAGAYPTIGDQLDAIWKALDALSEPLPGETVAMLKRIKEVKRRFPKGGRP